MTRLVTKTLAAQKSAFTKKVSVELITPAVADKMLQSNTGNRKLRVDRVERYAREMIKDQWLDDGSNIGFDWNERLIQGQHRLAGVVLAGATKPDISFEWVVVRNLDPAVYTVLDQGLQRSGADSLGADITNGKNKFAITRLFLVWDCGGDPRSKRDIDVIGRSDVAEYYHENQQPVDEATDMAAKFYSTFAGGNRSAWGAFILKVWELNQSGAEEFLEGVITGSNLPPGSAILALRNFLSNKRLQPTAGHHLAVLIKAWNDFLAGKSRQNMRFAPDEDFPVIRKNRAVARNRDA